eukprot:1177690-Prorocentrum_minimum.AAC.1
MTARARGAAVMPVEDILRNSLTECERTHSPVLRCVLTGEDFSTHVAATPRPAASPGVMTSGVGSPWVSGVIICSVGTCQTPRVSKIRGGVV